MLHIVFDIESTIETRDAYIYFHKKIRTFQSFLYFWRPSLNVDDFVKKIIDDYIT